jgi:hypothetical protein
MKFELTNKQRATFGIQPIDSKWNILDLNDYSKIYFDHNDVVRRLISYEYGYAEREYDIETENRKLLKPRTKRGKPKKLSYSTIINGSKPINVGFTYLTDQCAYNTNYNVDRTLFNSSYLKPRLSLDDLTNWIDDISNSATDELKKEISEFKALKRKRVKYKSGDIFSFRIDTSIYGFGQILLNINKIRNQFQVFNNASIGSAFGASVLARIFCHTSSRKKPIKENLSSSISLPSIILRDNQIHYGEYEIVEYMELRESDFEFPISFGLDNNLADPFHYLNYGFVTKTRSKNETPKEFIEKESAKSLDSPYRNNGSMGIVPFTLNELLRTQENGLDWFWQNVKYYSFEHDLRNPNNKQIKTKIFNHFGLKGNDKYNEIRSANGIKETLQIINDSA